MDRLHNSTLSAIESPSQTAVERMGAPTRIATELLDITPQLAADFLELNTRNRVLNQQAVADMARQMRAGLWRSTHQGIALDTNGDLIDGQHRLSAIVASGVTVPMLVTTGLEACAFDSIDTGRKRTAADTVGLTLGDAKHRNNIAATLAVEHLVNTGQRLRNVEVPALLEQNPDVRQAVEIGLDTYTAFRGHCPPRALTWFAMRARRAALHTANMFLDSLKTGADLPQTSPILQLRNRLLFGSSGPSSQVKFDRSGVFRQWLICRAWDAFLKGAEMRQLKLPADLDSVTWQTLPGKGMHPLEGKR